MAQTKNKQEAADALGVSVRTLLRLVDQGKLAHLPKRRPADETLFDEAELDRYQAEIEVATAGVVSGVVIPDTPGTPVTPDATGQNGALVRRGDAFTFADLLSAIDAAKAASPRPAPTILDLAHKLTLTLAEAAQLSGLSRAHLREAITAKKLKARILGRGWRVKREDLDLYVKKL